MTKLLRLLAILRTFGRYKIDELLPKNYRAVWFSALLWPFKIGAKKGLTPGQRLRLALEDLGPIFIKFGQLLSTRPDLIPEELIEELNLLQDRVKPFSPQQCKSTIETALGGTVEQLFAEFSEQPLASASIAQVHTAQLKTGEDVVVKVVRPNIRDTIAQDVELMAFFAEMFLYLSEEAKRLKPTEVVDEYRQTIFDELDLLREAANASQLRRNFIDGDRLYVPEVYWDYCRTNVMVMERVYGAQVTDLALLKKSNVDIKKLAERGVEIFFTQVFEHNFFHADMHPGNVYVDLTTPQDPKYIALDMAIMGSLSRQDQFYLARNMLAMFRRDYRQVAELHVMSGWVPKGTSIGAFESAIRKVCEPIFERPIKDIAFGDALVNLFQTARRFDMPIQPQLVLLQKTLLNIEGLGRQLYPDLDLWATAHPYLERWLRRRFHPKTLLQELKREAPEWMERFPQLPPLVFDALQQIKKTEQLTPPLADASELWLQQQSLQRRRKVRRTIAAVAFLAAGYFGWAQLVSFNREVVALLVLGCLALLSS